MSHVNCVFCALYEGSIEASAVFRNEHAMAAMTIRPLHVGHVLLFPRLHVEDFALLDQGRLGYLFHVAARLKSAICEAIPCEGFQVLINQGDATHQKSNCRHLHVHLIPCNLRMPGNVEGMAAEAPRSELDEAALENCPTLEPGDCGIWMTHGHCHPTWQLESKLARVALRCYRPSAMVITGLAEQLHRIGASHVGSALDGSQLCTLLSSILPDTAAGAVRGQSQSAYGARGLLVARPNLQLFFSDLMLDRVAEDALGGA